MSIYEWLPQWYQVAGFTAGLVTIIKLPDLLNKDKDRPQVEKKMVRLFENTKLINKEENTPQLQDIDKTDYGYRLKYYIPVGLTYSDFEKRKERIETALGGEVRLNPIDKNHVEVKAMLKKIMEEYSFNDQVIKAVQACELGISIGFNSEGYLTIDLAKEGTHLVIGGYTGAGKSVFLRQIITSIMMSYSPRYANFDLVDLKGGLEMGLFEGSPYLNSLSVNHNEVLDLVIELEKEMDSRFEVMRKEKVTKINELPGNKPPYRVVIIDEFADLAPDYLFGKERKTAKKIRNKLSRLFRQARAAGIHILICTQRPDSKVIDPQIRANIPVKIAFRVKDRTDSQVILRNNKAAQLPAYPGRGIFQYQNDITFQSPYLPPDQAQALLKKRYKELRGKIKREKPQKETASQGVFL